MSEMVTIAREELTRLEERARKLALEKSYLQLVNNLINHMSAVPGLENTVETIVKIVMENLGGINVTLYYLVDQDIHGVDIYGHKGRLPVIQDELVREALTTRQFIERVHESPRTGMNTPGFSQVSTWARPLLVGDELIGVLSIEDMLLSAGEIREQLRPFFNYTALVLKNEIQGYTRLKTATDQLQEKTEELRLAKVEEAESRIAGFYNRSLIEASVDPLMTIGINGKITDVNAATEQITGQTRENLIGTDFSEYFTDPEQAREGYRKAFQQGIVRDHALEIRHRDGRITPVLYNATTFQDLTGRTVGVFAAARDMTELRRAERQIQHLASFPQFNPDPVIEVDPAGRITFCNPAGQAALERWKEDSASIFFPADMPEIMKAAEAGHPTPVQREVAIRDNLFHESICFVPEFRTLRIYTRDITLRNRAERELERYKEGLEKLVKERTAELQSLNQRLRQEIEERKHGEETIRLSLREKELLLRELHHRVKNNLLIVSSLLELQAKLVVDPGALVAFRESQARIDAMALIHEKLYQPKAFGRIHFGEYLEELVSYISSASRNDRVTVDIDAGDISFDINTAIPCGLIINELVSNAFKYAFPGQRQGRIEIQMRRSGEKRILVVRDDGVGLPPQLDWKKCHSLGLQLVGSLVEQLDGVIERKDGLGTIFQIEFCEIKYKQRA